MLCCKQPPADAQRRLLLYEHNMGRYDDQRWLKILMLDYYTYSIHRRQGLSLLCSSSMRMENGNNTALVLTAKHISSTWIDSFNRDHSDLCCSDQCIQVVYSLSITNVFLSGMGVRLIWFGDLAGQTAFSQNEDGKPTTFSSLSPPDKLGAFIDSEFRLWAHQDSSASHTHLTRHNYL